METDVPSSKKETVCCCCVLVVCWFDAVLNMLYSILVSQINNKTTKATEQKNSIGSSLKKMLKIGKNSDEKQAGNTNVDEDDLVRFLCFSLFLYFVWMAFCKRFWALLIVLGKLCKNLSARQQGTSPFLIFGYIF